MHPHVSVYIHICIAIPVNSISSIIVVPFCGCFCVYLIYFTWPIYMKDNILVAKHKMVLEGQDSSSVRVKYFGKHFSMLMNYWPDQPNDIRKECI